VIQTGAFDAVRHRAQSSVVFACTAAVVWVGCVSGSVAGTISADIDPTGESPRSHEVIIHLAADDRAVEPLSRGTAAEKRRLDAVAEITAHATAKLREAVERGDLEIRRAFRLQPTIAATVTDAGLTAVGSSDVVTWVEPDRRFVPLTQEGLELIGATTLHDLGIAGEGTAVAIIDTGVDYLHPTLGGGQIPNAKVIYGLDTADLDDDPMDCHGHGTAVASVAAGSSYQWSPNRRFAGGVAPAALILAYKVTSDIGCRAASTSSVIAAIEDAVLHRTGDDYRLAAINISLGGETFSGPCDDANLAYSDAVATAVDAGIAVVAAAGNGGYPDSLDVPACIARTISVASAWDVDSGANGYSFCLDPECRRWCDDSFKWQGAVACYSNSNAYLDVVAPSEFLRAADSGGVTVEFGGTSGAAAYVTGAAALLAQALPTIDPTTTRFLLAATGRPTMDDKNGLVRPIVDLAAALEGASRIAVTPDPDLTISRQPDPPLESAIFVDQTGLVGSLKVMLDLSHSSPNMLRVTLTAPGGTTVVLHDMEPGTTPASTSAERFDGITGTYPDDLEPNQSLGRLANRQLNGWWSLTVEDFSPTEGSQKPMLHGWALVPTPLGEPSPDEVAMVFPVVARAQGAHGTSWRSDVRLFNPSDRHESQVEIFLMPPSGESSVGLRQTLAIVPHGSSLALDDIVESRFGLESGRGSLVVQDPSGNPLDGTSRTYTTSASGTFGQFIAPLVSGARSTGVGEPPLVVLPITGDDHRINIGFTEVEGAVAAVAMTVIDGLTGAALGPSTFYLVDAFENLQLNGGVPGTEPGSAVEPYMTISVVQGQGRIAAYASVIDNRTGDAIFVDGGVPEVAPYLVVPVVARTQGQAGTSWQSDLRILNHGSFSVHVDAELRLRGSVGLPPVVESFELRAGEALTIEDVVGSLFGFDQTAGSLRLVPREGSTALCAASRTANHISTGTYGQYIPAVQPSRGVAGHGTLVHLEDSPRARSNIGLVELDGTSATVELRLKDDRGRALGASAQLSLGPWESVQINDIFSALGVQPHDNARLDIDRLSGSGRYSAYASVIDSESGDAIYVPVLPIPN
jgi:subtilisin family serine protease/subtilisin-like proprotein convertase family protein